MSDFTALMRVKESMFPAGCSTHIKGVVYEKWKFKLEPWNVGVLTNKWFSFNYKKFLRLDGLKKTKKRKNKLTIFMQHLKGTLTMKESCSQDFLFCFVLFWRNLCLHFSVKLVGQVSATRNKTNENHSFIESGSILTLIYYLFVCLCF